MIGELPNIRQALLSYCEPGLLSIKFGRRSIRTPLRGDTCCSRLSRQQLFLHVRLWSEPVMIRSANRYRWYLRRIGDYK